MVFHKSSDDKAYMALKSGHSYRQNDNTVFTCRQAVGGKASIGGETVRVEDEVPVYEDAASAKNLIGYKYNIVPTAA